MYLPADLLNPQVPNPQRDFKIHSTLLNSYCLLLPNLQLHGYPLIPQGTPKYHTGIQLGTFKYPHMYAWHISP